MTTTEIVVLIVAPFVIPIVVYFSAKAARIGYIRGDRYCNKRKE